MAVSNARTHRDVQRARADLEALIDTSPVGVVVLDARTGTPLSSNREAHRMFDALRMPDRSLEQLLEVLVVKRADGRQISLAEVPLAKELDGASTVRRRGSRDWGPRRAFGDHPDQQHAGPLAGRRCRVSGGDPAGPVPDARVGAACAPSSWAW